MRGLSNAIMCIQVNAQGNSSQAQCRRARKAGAFVSSLACLLAAAPAEVVSSTQKTSKDRYTQNSTHAWQGAPQPNEVLGLCR